MLKSTLLQICFKKPESLQFFQSSTILTWFINWHSDDISGTKCSLPKKIRPTSSSESQSDSAIINNWILCKQNRPSSPSHNLRKRNNRNVYKIRVHPIKWNGWIWLTDIWNWDRKGPTCLPRTLANAQKYRLQWICSWLFLTVSPVDGDFLDSSWIDGRMSDH